MSVNVKRINSPNKPLTKTTECSILNLNDSSKDQRSHWVAWFKKGFNKYYFNTYGVQRPLELTDYLKSPIYYSAEVVQPRNQVVCGYLCLYIEKHLTHGK